MLCKKVVICHAYSPVGGGGMIQDELKKTLSLSMPNAELRLFELNDLDCKVDFLESSALELDSLKGVKKWIQEVA